MDRATAQPERNRLSALWLPGILLVVGIPTMIFGSFLLGLIVTLVGLLILGAFAPRRRRGTVIDQAVLLSGAELRFRA
jgi:hypothetical protein